MEFWKWNKRYKNLFFNSFSGVNLENSIVTSKQFKCIQSIRQDFHEGSERLKSSSNNSIRTLADDLYNKHTHFIFELIQNAEDNAYDNQNAYPPYISFRLTKTDPTDSAGSDGALIIQNNEIGFNRDNVDAICAVGVTTKVKEQGYIGEKGIGFKSVFRVTGNPHIFSNGYHFCLPESDAETGLGYIVPQWVHTVPKGLDLSGTCIILPLTKKDFGYEEIEKMLQDIEPEVILFLSTLQEIQIKTDTGDDFTILKDGSAMPEVQILVEGKKTGNDFSKSDGFLVCTERYSKPVNLNHKKRLGIENRDVTIGFPLDENSTAVGKIFAYLPVKEGTGFPFLINSDFILPSSREEVLDVPWNRSWLMECVADLTAKKLLPLLKERKLLSVSFLNVLTDELNNLAEDKENLFYPIFNKLRQTFMNAELFPTNDGLYVSAKNAVLTRSDAVRNLLTHTQLGILMYPDADYDVSLKWLSSEVTLDRTPVLRRYLMESLGIEEVTPDMLARRLSDTFLISQTDEWFIKFYRFLFNQPALWRSNDAVLRNKPILRLQDGKHVNPPQEGSFPTAYLSVGRGTNDSLPIVKWEISQDQDAYNFMKTLGVQECDLVAEVIETVLPKYKREIPPVSINEHLQDFAKIQRAYKTDSREKKEQLKTMLQETPFIRSEKPDRHGNLYFKPDHIYSITEPLRLYFEGNSAAAFINLDIYPRSAKELFTDLGALDFVRIKREIPDEEGYTIVARQHGYHKRGLNEFDPGIIVDGLEHALNNLTLEKSSFIWNHIAIPNADCIKGFMEASSTQTYSNSSFEEIISYSFGHLLINTVWLPDADGIMHKPSDITLDDLPDSFKKDEQLAKQLSMPISRARMVDLVAPEIGVSSDILNGIVNATPETIQQIESLLQLGPNLDHLPSSPSLHFDRTLSPQPTTFPVSSVSNPTRRKKRVLEELESALEQEFVQRLRSVRTTKNAIDPKTWLKTQYTNDNNQMVCQICQEEMPFKYSDENYYFDAVEMLKGHFTKEYEAQFLALCPECSPKYKMFVKQAPKAMEVLKKQLMDLDDSSNFQVPLRLGNWDINLRFVERHWLDIKTILSFYEQQSEDLVETTGPDEKQPEQDETSSSQPAEKKENWDSDRILTQSFTQPIRFATYDGLKDLSQIKTRQDDLTGIDAKGAKITLPKFEILFAFPKEKMSALKPHVHMRRLLKGESLQPVDAYGNRFQIADKLLRQVKEHKSTVKVVTRAGYILNGWIQHFDKYVLYMRVGEKVVIVYRHGLYGFTIEEQ